MPALCRSTDSEDADTSTKGQAYRVCGACQALRSGISSQSLKQARSGKKSLERSQVTRKGGEGLPDNSVYVKPISSSSSCTPAERGSSSAVGVASRNSFNMGRCQASLAQCWNALASFLEILPRGARSAEPANPKCQHGRGELSL